MSPNNNLKLTELVKGKKSSTPLYSPDLFSTNTLWMRTHPWQMFFECSSFKPSRTSFKTTVISCKEYTKFTEFYLIFCIISQESMQ